MCEGVRRNVSGLVYFGKLLNSGDRGVKASLLNNISTLGHNARGKVIASLASVTAALNMLVTITLPWGTCGFLLVEITALS